MAQLHEFQAKTILNAHGISIPRGEVARTADEAREIARSIGGPVVLKAQVHSTSRAANGGIRFADSPQDAEKLAGSMLGTSIAGNLCEALLIDEKAKIEREFYCGFIVDTVLKRPTLLFSADGGSGIEERADSMQKLICSIRHEPTIDEVRGFIAEAAGDLADDLASALLGLYRSARSCEARTAEINPLALLNDGRLVALDARISVDDYAVFRHEDLGIEMARELGHSPTVLERIAWRIERDDFRGTFYFVEIAADSGSGIRIGFHGAGGGGSMASLDAAQRNGLAPACYVDTSGNPPASKVYRAARIILSIPGIRGYFLSGSGVASQEQFGLARAVIKAFLETRPSIPAVLRLGGNGEDIAKELVERYAERLPAPIEAYRKRDSADSCAARLRELIASETPKRITNDGAPATDFQGSYDFKTRTGSIAFDYSRIDAPLAVAIVESCPQKILRLEAGRPVLAIEPAEAERGKCSECLACEFAALDRGSNAVRIEFPIDGLEARG